MKKFTCLFGVVLLITYTTSATPCESFGTANMSSNIWVNALSSLQQNGSAFSNVTGTLLLNGTYAPQNTSVCNNFSQLCCDPTVAAGILSAQISSFKNAINNFGVNTANIGAVWTKISALINATSIGGNSPSTLLTNAGNDTTKTSGATGAQFQAFSQYTINQLNSDFVAFQSNAQPCFNFYSTTIQNIMCDGCSEITMGEVTGFWSRYNGATSASIPITQASCDAWAAACMPTWNFMWKAGWFVQSIAYLANQNSSSNSYVPAATNLTGVYYFSDNITVDNINTALVNCGAGATSNNTSCQKSDRANLCQAFINVLGTGADTINQGVGRSDETFLSNKNFAGSRRILQSFAKADGTVAVVNTTIALDLTSPTVQAMTIAPSPALSNIDSSSWSTGYVGPATSGSSGSSTTTNTTASSMNASKVLQGSLFIALLTIALYLN